MKQQQLTYFQTLTEMLLYCITTETSSKNLSQFSQGCVWHSV